MISKYGIVSVYGYVLGLLILPALLLLENDPFVRYVDNVNGVQLFVFYSIIASVLVRIFYGGVAFTVSTIEMPTPDTSTVNIGSVRLRHSVCSRTTFVTGVFSGLVLGLGDGRGRAHLAPSVFLVETVWLVMKFKRYFCLIILISPGEWRQSFNLTITTIT